MMRPGIAVLLACGLALSCRSGFRPVDLASIDSLSPDARAADRASSGWTLVYEDSQAAPTESLNALWVADAGHVFAVGDNRQIVWLEGGGWQSMVKTQGAHLYGVSGRSATDVTAAGLYAYNGSPAIFHYDGTMWAAEGPIPSQVKALSDLWTVGAQTYYVGIEGRIYQDDPVNHPTDRYHLASVTGGCPLQTDPSPALWGIDGSGLSNILVAGERGLLAHFDQQSWTRLCHPDPQVSYRAVFRLPGTTDFMVGGAFFGLYRFSIRTAPLMLIHEDRSQVGADGLHVWSIFATSAANVIAVGDGGAILYWNGAGAARRLPSPTTDSLFGVSGVDERTIYICGQRNRIWRGRLPTD